MMAFFQTKKIQDYPTPINSVGNQQVEKYLSKNENPNLWIILKIDFQNHNMLLIQYKQNSSKHHHQTKHG
jgi:dolichyl-phosphate-mannose--protein O-mannosyl transferase